MLPFLNENKPPFQESEIHEQSEDIIKMVYLAVRNKQLHNACNQCIIIVVDEKEMVSIPFTKRRYQFSIFKKTLTKLQGNNQEFIQVHDRMIKEYPGYLDSLFSKKVKNIIEFSLGSGKDNLEFLNGIKIDDSIITNMRPA